MVGRTVRTDVTDHSEETGRNQPVYLGTRTRGGVGGRRRGRRGRGGREGREGREGRGEGRVRGGRERIRNR